MPANAVSVASPYRQSQKITAHWRVLARKSVSYHLHALLRITLIENMKDLRRQSISNSSDGRSLAFRRTV